MNILYDDSHSEMLGRSEDLRLDMRHAEEIRRIDLLESWKEIACFLGREVRTVQLWEKREGLPVHRHFHAHRASVHAYRSQLKAWRNDRSIPRPEHKMPAHAAFNS
jgi:hypothetical protein